jgi:uncharacterized protein
LALVACSVVSDRQAPAGPTPQVDHHQHLLSPALTAVFSESEVTADRLIAQLDAAGIRRAVVLSLAYMHGRPTSDNTGDDEYARVRAENDWTAAQVARYPDRLVAFCSVNPLKEYALAELDRCMNSRGLRRGLKLHFANSRVDVQNPLHLRRLQQVFRAANERRMAIVVHVWSGPSYGRTQAEIFLSQILPEAPDVPVQIAHLAGSGPHLDPGSRDALAMLADAVAAHDSRTRNLYFDLTTVITAGTPPGTAGWIAARLRQIGLTRILYGSDMALGGNATARESWAAIRAKLPLTAAELETIAANVAPYLRQALAE